MNCSVERGQMSNNWKVDGKCETKKTGSFGEGKILVSARFDWNL